MTINKLTASKLKQYAQVFKEARERGANEADTVMLLIKMFEDALGYNSLLGEITKEVAIKERYCDFCVKIDGEIKYIIEAKASGHKNLKGKNIEQAENYASRAGIRWVLLTNGIEWQLYHLVFAEAEGINHDLIFSFNLIDEIENNIDRIGTFFRLISKEGVLNGELEIYLSQKKVLSPSSLIKILFSESVLSVIRRELNRVSEFRLDIEDVFNSIKEVISKDSLMEAGDLCFKKRRKRKQRLSKSESPILNENNQVEIQQVEPQNEAEVVASNDVPQEED